MNIKLNELNYDKKYKDEDEYLQKLKKWQNRLLAHQLTLRGTHNRLILVFEGMDAAGKGGSIKRLVERLDPRHIDVVPITVPTDEEKQHHYLWRFWTRMPKHGQIAIFDRSWYGRVLVERIEKFAQEKRWKAAYDEINAWEKMMYADGAVILKFWLHITKSEQLKRFKEREEKPHKQWKITPDDYRNRKKWNDYVLAAEEMLKKTSTRDAPWFAVPSNHKWRARVSIIKTVVEELDRRCGEPPDLKRNSSGKKKKK